MPRSRRDRAEIAPRSRRPTPVNKPRCAGRRRPSTELFVALPPTLHRAPTTTTGDYEAGTAAAPNHVSARTDTTWRAKYKMTTTAQQRQQQQQHNNNNNRSPSTVCSRRAATWAGERCSRRHQPSTCARECVSWTGTCSSTDAPGAPSRIERARECAMRCTVGPAPGARTGHCAPPAAAGHSAPHAHSPCAAPARHRGVLMILKVNF